MTVADEPSRKHLVLGIASLASAAAVLALFAICCWSAAADAQGAIAFVCVSPGFLLGLVAAFLLARAARPWPGARIASGAAKATAALLACFFLSAMIPGLRFISDGIIGAVAGGYELVTGHTPYQADKGRAVRR